MLEMQRGYIVNTEEDPDEIIYAGFSKETAKSFIENFEKYLDENKDSIEALRILYNSEDTRIYHRMRSYLFMFRHAHAVNNVIAFFGIGIRLIPPVTPMG